MVNRRTTVLAMIGTGLSCVTMGRVLGAERTPPNRPASPEPPATAADRELKDDLAKMGAHEYSDEGIPVFLACVDLAAQHAGKPPAPPTEFSALVAANLRRYGDAWRRMHPDAPDTDVSKVIEVLAARDFAHGGIGGAR